MNNEQNLDDILKLLQESVDNLDSSEDMSEDNDPSDADLSTEDLQKKLEARYFSEGVSGNHESDTSYELDSDFLAEFSSVDIDDTDIEKAETVNSEITDMAGDRTDVEDLVAEETVDPDMTEEIEELEEVEEPEELEEIEELEEVEELEEPEKLEEVEEFTELEVSEAVEASDEYDETENFGGIEDNDELGDLAELCELENCYVSTPSACEEPIKIGHSSPVVTLEPSKPENIEEAVENEATDDELFEEADDDELFEEATDDGYDVIDTQTIIDEEVQAEKVNKVTEEKEDEAVCKSTFDEYSAFPKEKPKSFKALMMDYGRPDPIPSPKKIEEELAVSDGLEDETPDIGDILSDFADDAPTKEDRMNTSMKELMTSLGCEDELECVSAEAIGEVYGEFTDTKEKDDEESSAETVEKNRYTYKKGIAIATVKLVVCAIMTAVMFLYDTLPIFDVDFIGLADYVLYPGAYVMIGAQLLLICAVCLWRPMWGGIKRLMTAYPNIYSMAAVMVAFNIAYDTVFFITGNYKPLETPMFHFLCGAILTGISIYELQMRIRESAAFDIYSTDVAKFTLTYDKSKHSIGEKMYSGGFSRSKKVYSPSPVTYPKGFLKAIRENGSFGNGIFSSLMIIAVGIGVLLALALMIAGRSLDESVVAAMTSVMVLLPVSAVTAITLPLSISSIRLKKRGIALTGREMIRKYGEKNALVFGDLHLFKKCDPRQIGFVCYEKLQTKNILASLNILYSRIGGPMGSAFSNIPDECKAKTIRVRRITKSGIEAVVDKSHTLIVGDIEFLRRYGIEFPSAPVSKSNGKNATLYISLDGRASAKLTAVYCVEPLFDMLIERLSAEKIHCVIETYDPMINTAFVARQRKKGRAPISVVHKNAADINCGVRNAKKGSDHGILALSSRLKLAEAVVWCARLCKLEKINNIIIYSTIGVGFVTVLLLSVFGIIPCIIQYLLLAYFLCIVAAVFAVTLGLLPRRNYFSVAAMEAEDAALEETNNKQEERKDK